MLVFFPLPLIPLLSPQTRGIVLGGCSRHSRLRPSLRVERAASLPEFFSVRSGERFALPYVPSGFRLIVQFFSPQECSGYFFRIRAHIARFPSVPCWVVRGLLSLKVLRSIGASLWFGGGGFQCRFLSFWTFLLFSSCTRYRLSGLELPSRDSVPGAAC